MVESLLAKPNLVIREQGTLNKQEPTINFGDPESRGIVSFENNLLYENHHLISSYPISEKAFQKFKETGNIGMSQEERAQELMNFKKLKCKQNERKQLHDRFIVIYRKMLALEISNWVKLKFLKSSVSKILAFH